MPSLRVLSEKSGNVAYHMHHQPSHLLGHVILSLQSLTVLEVEPDIFSPRINTVM